MLVRGVACQSSAGAVQKKSTSGVPYPAGGVGHRAKMPACTTESSRMSAWPLTWSVAMWCSVPRPIPGDRVASAVAKRRNNFRALVAEGRPSAVGSSRNPERINAAQWAARRSGAPNLGCHRPAAVGYDDAALAGQGSCGHQFLDR